MDDIYYSIEKACIPNEYIHLLSSLRIDVLSEHTNNFFFSYDVMEALRCISNCLTSYDNNFLSKEERFREYIVSLLENKNKKEYSVSIKTYTDGIFSIKSCTDKSDEISLFREAILGNAYLNILRKKIPTFRYYFDIIECSPIISLNEEYAICATSGNGYLICEKLPDVYLSDIIKDLSIDEFIKIYLIILLSLREAHKICKLTVYNLIPEIISIRNKEISMVFEHNQSSFSISTDKIPVISNFDMAYFEHQNQKIYNQSFAEEFNLFNEFFPIYDAFKLLCTSLIIFRKNNINISRLLKLLKFFGLKSYEEMIEKYQAKSFGLTRGKIFFDIFDEFINYVIVEFRIRRETNLTQLAYPSKNLLDELNILGLSEEQQLSFVTFYDNCENHIDYCLRNFSIFEAFNDEKIFIDKNLMKLRSGFFMEKFNSDKAFSGIIYLNNIKKRIHKLIISLNIFNRLKLRYKIGIFMIDTFQESYDLKEMSEYYEKLGTSLIYYIRNIERIKDIITEDIKELTDYQYDSIYGWYLFGYNLLFCVIEEALNIN